MERNIPNNIPSYGKVIKDKKLDSIRIKKEIDNTFIYNRGVTNKLVSSIQDVLIKTKIKNGDTISFHHHLRDGDFVLNLVMDEIANLGIKDINLCVSSLLNVHSPLIQHIKNGVVAGISTSGLRGDLAKEISYNNILKQPVVFRTHGGRARAIQVGTQVIDIAFIATSACDVMGNMNSRVGKSRFGSMGYAMVDADYSKQVVAITDNIVEYPLKNPSINQTKVDFVVEIDAIGDPTKIATGATRITTNEKDLKIAQYAAQALIHTGYVRNGFSFQAGSGGSSLAVIKYLKQYMAENQIVGSFASGGITSVLTELLEEGFFKSLLDTQTFDNDSANSLNENPNHIEMSADMYANPFNKGAVCNMLDVMILSATEVDLNFNVNVLTGSHGVILGAQGGHPDTAECAKLNICTIPLVRKNRPIIVDNVTTLVTKGEFIDILVTDYGIAINPLREDLLEVFKNTNLPILTIQTLHLIAKEMTGTQEMPKFNKHKIVGIVEGRNGTVMDVCYQVEKKFERVDEPIILQNPESIENKMNFNFNNIDNIILESFDDKKDNDKEIQDFEDNDELDHIDRLPLE